MVELTALARSWWRSRPVLRLTQVSLLATVIVLAVCARAIRHDASTVAVAERTCDLILGKPLLT